MNTKKVIAAIVLGLFMVPALASAYTYAPSHYGTPARETLVEGHTVFAVIAANICVDQANERIVCPSGGSFDADASYDIRGRATVQRLGAAVAVLVRDRVKEVTPTPISPTCTSNKDIVGTLLYENPGVLWFNDQFLVGDDLDIIETEADANVDVCAKTVSDTTNFGAQPWSYPCGGWVWATQAGNPDPRTASVTWVYEESYYITDPNDKVWVIDKYSPLPLGVGPITPVDRMVDAQLDDDNGAGTQYDYDDLADGDLRVVAGGGAPLQYYLGQFNMWTVPVSNGYNLQADGQNGVTDVGAPNRGGGCAPTTDAAAAAPGYNTYGIDEAAGLPDPTVGPQDTDVTAGGGNSADVEAFGAATPAVQYNAVLFFFFEDLAPKGVKVHGLGGANDFDYSYCQSGTEWTCPSGSVTADAQGADLNGDGVADDLNGDGVADDPAPRTVGLSQGDDAEGNSHPYNSASTTSGPIHNHLTAGVDLYFHNVRAPAVPDTTGDLVADRRYAVFDTVGAAAPVHTHGSEVFDDRISGDACADADVRYQSMTRTYNGGQAGWNTASSSTGFSDADDCTAAGYGGGVTGAPGEEYDG